MNTAQIAYLEARIEEERCRKVEEAEATYRRDMEALEVVRGLYERYGASKAPEEAETASSEPEPETSDPPAAPGTAEEEQRVEADETEPEPVHSEPEEREVPESYKFCKRCGPEVGPKPLAAFGKDVRGSDGHARTCSGCMSEARRAGRQKQIDAAKAPASPEGTNGGVVASSGPPMRITVPLRTPEFEAEHRGLLDEVVPPQALATFAEGPRLCASGNDCVDVKHTGEPRRLNSRNTGAVCYGCEERETALGSRPVGTLGPLVRKSNADKATG